MKKSEISNVLFFGGSITQGAAASDYTKCYASLTAEWLKSIYGTDTIHYINKGVGGTDSIYGLLRLKRDVIAYEPDLIFIEFAVNDSGFDSGKYVESIIRSLKSLSSNPYVIFLYTTNNEYTTPTKNFEKIAEHYGIPQISLKNALKTNLNNADPISKGYLADGVHPTDKGHRIYADEIIKCLSSNEYFKKPNYEQEPLNTDCFTVDTEFISSCDAKQIGDWKHGIIHENVLGDKAYSVTTGDLQTLELKFTGNIVAVEHGLHDNGGKYKIYIDGVFQKEFNTYWKDFESNQLVLSFFTFDLPCSHHTIKIETDKNDGRQVLIYNIITGTKHST